MYCFFFICANFSWGFFSWGLFFFLSRGLRSVGCSFLFTSCVSLPASPQTRHPTYPRWYPLFFFRAAVYLRCFRAFAVYLRHPHTRLPRHSIRQLNCRFDCPSPSVYRYSVIPLYRFPTPLRSRSRGYSREPFFGKNHSPSCEIQKKAVILHTVWVAQCPN